MGEKVLKSPIVQEKGLNEVLYTAIMGMTQDQKNYLPDRLKRHIKTSKRAQNFVAKSSLDLKREFLQYLEYSCYVVICPAGATGARKFKQIFEEFANGNIQNGLIEAAKNGVFVTGDKEFSFLLGRLAQGMTTSAYAQNLELMRAGSLLKKWPKRLTQNEDDDYPTTADLLAKIILWSSINMERSELAVGLSSDQLKVLIFMYINRQGYIKKETIVTYFSSLISGLKMTSTMKFLAENQLIQKHVDWRKKEYTITKLGIQTVHQFRDRVLKSFNF